MPTNDRFPVVNQNLLHELEEQFEDPGPVHSFARDFVAIWDERYSRLADALGTHNPEASLEALLSVKIASTMIGASRLARLAAELEYHLKRGHLEAVAGALPEVKKCGDATIRELVRSYIDADC